MSNYAIALRQEAIDRLKTSPDKPTDEEYVGRLVFLCDGKACVGCIYPECKHTTDINHAKNFQKQKCKIGDTFWEMEPENDKLP